MNSLIRLLVRETLIQENESPLVRAANEGYAVFQIEGPVTKLAIIYSPELLFYFTENSKTYDDINLSIKRSHQVDRCIVRAAVSYGRSSNKNGPCWNSSVIKYSVAASKPLNMPKVGPAAYEAAMWYSKNHTLAPDRGSVSKKAEKVWDRYLTRSNNNGITSKEFDDIGDPITPAVDDDCDIYQGRNSINRAYTLQSKPEGLEILERNHQKCIDEFEEKYNNDLYEYDRNALGSAFRSLSIRLFDSEYSE